jgi:hypothetical protein
LAFAVESLPTVTIAFAVPFDPLLLLYPIVTFDERAPRSPSADADVSGLALSLLILLIVFERRRGWFKYLGFFFFSAFADANNAVFFFSFFSRGLEDQVLE